MEDKIIQMKNEMARIIKVEGLTRLERYDLMKRQTKALNKKEMKILIDEYRRDYETYDRSKDTKELIAVGLTGIGLLITVLSIFQKRIEGSIHADSLLLGVYVIIGIVVLSLSLLQANRSRKMDATRYILDILEAQYKKRFIDHESKL